MYIYIYIYVYTYTYIHISIHYVWLKRLLVPRAPNLHSTVVIPDYTRSKQKDPNPKDHSLIIVL